MCTCDRALELINEKIDQCITEEKESVLCSHLSKCDACRGIYETYSLIQQDLLDLAEEPPENFAGQIMFRVKAEQQKKKRKAPYGLIGTVACAAALVLVIGVTGMPKMMSPKAENNAMSMAKNASSERALDYSVTSDTAADYEAPMEACNDAAEPEVYADGWANDVIADESEQFDADKGEMVYPELTSYAIVLVYDSFDAIGSYADRLEFVERPEGLCATVSIDLAREIYEVYPNALHYEVNQQALAACQNECIILIQK